MTVSCQADSVPMTEQSFGFPHFIEMRVQAVLNTMIRNSSVTQHAAQLVSLDFVTCSSSIFLVVSY